MKVSETYRTNSDYLKASDLPRRKVPVTIALCELVEFDDGNKLVLSFEGKDKRLVLNKTNAASIAAALGDDAHDWVGREIAIFPTVTQFQGQSVPCIRVEVAPPAADEGDEIPF